MGKFGPLTVDLCFMHKYAKWGDDDYDDGCRFTGGVEVAAVALSQTSTLAQRSNWGSAGKFQLEQGKCEYLMETKGELLILQD